MVRVGGWGMSHVSDKRVCLGKNWSKWNFKGLRTKGRDVILYGTCDYNHKALSHPKTKYTLPSFFYVKYWPQQKDLLRITHKTFKVRILFLFFSGLSLLCKRNSNFAKKRFFRWVWDGQLVMCRIRCGLSQTWAFSHAFLTEIQIGLHTNKCAMRFELSSVKWLQNTPFVPAPAWKWREVKVTGQWMSAACDWALAVSLAGRTATHCVGKRVCLHSRRAGRIILWPHQQVWGTFQKYFWAKVNVIFYWTRLGLFFHT